MNLTSKLKGIATAGLIGLAGLLPTTKADAQAIMKIGPVDEYNNFVTNDLVINQPARFGVHLDLTGDPTKGIRYADWDVFFGSLTNYVTLNGAQLPNHTTSEDFFVGYGMDSSYNRVDGTLSITSYADDNVRDVIGAGSGPTNTAGFLGFYDITPTALATNVRARVANYSIVDTTGASVPVTRQDVYFSVIPEPKTLGLVGVAGAALGAFRRRFNKSGKRGK
jgi:hypothetical protein